MRILLVDDDENVTESLGLIFESLGHEVKTACSYEGALIVAYFFKPHIVFTDYKMGESTGTQVVHGIRSYNDLAYIVVMSGLNTIEIVKETMKAGADDFLLKPLLLADIELKLADAKAKFEAVPSLNEVREKHIRQLLKNSDSLKEAAAKLGVNPSTLWRKRKLA